MAIGYDAPGKEKVIMDQLMKAYKAYHIVRKVPDQFEFTADFS